jgi:hypothetical protein
LRPVWAIYQVPGWPGLHSESLSQKKKKKSPQNKQQQQNNQKPEEVIFRKANKS